MGNQRGLRWIGKSIALLGLLFVGLWLYQPWGSVSRVFGADGGAAARVAQVWANVRNSTAYNFSADVTLTTIPLPTAGNIGRFSKTDSLYLEGSNNLADETMQMALWGGGVSVADRANAYQMRVQDGATQIRVGNGEWQANKGDTLSFVPEGDFLAFLDIAKNVAFASEQPTNTEGQNMVIYTFDLDGRAYAEKLTRITQKQLVRDGQLPPGVSIQIPNHLAKLTGSGELWIDARGLPVRQKIAMSMPPTPGSDNRTETVMDIYFSDYQLDPPLLAAVPLLQPLAHSLTSIALPTPYEAGTTFALFSLTLVGMAILIRPSRRTQLSVTVVTLFAIILTPTLQAQASSLAIDRLTAYQARAALSERPVEIAQKELENQKAAVEAAPYAPPETALNLPAAAPALQTVMLDSDGDGLTDAQEQLIGTNALASDSDGDTIGDKVEITGFSFGGKQWYGDPRLSDSNKDGVVDGQEWSLDNPDRDGDNTPDLYDFDDDGDGVPDQVDLSRLVTSKADNGTLITFTQANPLQLTVDGLNSGSYSFVDLQLRPTNPDRLWYAFNVLNWPKDEKGNVQDWDGMTFFDYCKRTGGSNCSMSPDDNGDIKLVPMLEVTLPDLSNLPRQANGTLDKTRLQNYGIFVQPAGDGSYLAYVPLLLVEDPATGGKVAFQGQMVYQAGSQWRPQAVRLVWTVNLLNEQYTNPDAAKKVFAANGGKGTNQNIILHAYYDEFQLTGLNVREDRGVDMAIVYEDPTLDPARNDDDALFQMTRGLEGSFFTNRDCDFLDNAGKCVGNG